eukprot:c548_g1_i1 orf=378-548(+)
MKLISSLHMMGSEHRDGHRNQQDDEDKPVSLFIKGLGYFRQQRVASFQLIFGYSLV